MRLQVVLFQARLLAYNEEAVIHVACILVISRDRPCRVVAVGGGALAGACARAGSIERGDGAVVIPQEAVIQLLASM